MTEYQTINLNKIETTYQHIMQTQKYRIFVIFDYKCITYDTTKTDHL